MQLDIARIFEGMIAGLRSTGLKDAAIAKGAHISRTTIWRYAQGDGKQGSAENYLKLASFYEQRTGSPPSIPKGRR